MSEVFVAVDVEWISLAYGDVTRVMQTPEQFMGLIRVSLERFGVRIAESKTKLVLYDAPRDATRGVVHKELQNRGFELKLGHVMERRQHNGAIASVQKGVDVMLTVDAMVEIAGGIKTFVIMTSDSDFVPLLQYAKYVGVQAVVLGRTGTASQLAKAADVACGLVME